jgi:hypothetical protein
MKLPAWLERASPGDLGVLLGKTGSPRKCGLFVRHLCRSHPEAFADPRSLAALDGADRFEAGEIDEAAHQAAIQGAVGAAQEAEARMRAAEARMRESAAPSGGPPTSYLATHYAMTAAQTARDVAVHGCYKRVMADLMRVVGASTCPRSTSRKRVARAIRLLFLEHFGDVQRAAVPDPSWRTGAVVAVAAAIYAGRAFADMPILGDALEDAGCANADVLGHCRGPGPHARGCWVLDLILGKA